MLNGLFNPVQIQAIKAATKLAGVTMIQGNKDSGKSETIFGIISTLLSLKQKQKEREWKRYTIKELMENDSSEDEEFKASSETKKIYVNYAQDIEMKTTEAKFEKISPIILKKREETVDDRVP